MSYESFAKQEMALAGTPKHIQKAVQRAIKDIDAMGHSGASIDIYSGMVANWLRGGRGLTTPESRLDHVAKLPEQFRATLGELSIEDTVTMVMLVNALMRFEPLTPLTGNDDEWVNVYEDMYQNRRCSTVFKEGRDGEAYHLDQFLFAYPNESFTAWYHVGRGHDLSSRTVVFPYDVQAPVNQRQITYFTHDDWETPLPAGIEPNAWLTWMHERQAKGINPTTNQVRRDTMFVLGSDRHVFAHELRMVLCYLKYNWETVTYQDVVERLGWVADIDEPFVMHWKEPDAETDDIHDHEFVLTDAKRAKQLLRLFALFPYPDIDLMVGMGDSPNAPMLIDTEHNEYYLCYREVMLPSGAYQKWVGNRTYVPVWSVTRDVSPFYFHDGQKVTGDHEEYLFQKRREYGYAHPRNRKLSIQLDAKDDNPTATVNALAKEFHGVPLDPQEGKQIDDVVAKHVGKVFKATKKD